VSTGKIVSKKQCPICGRPTVHAYNITEDEKTEKGGLWFNCSCGVIFQDKFPADTVYDDDHVNRFITAKEFEEKSFHAQRTYINLIEELVYGRKWLDVGFCYENPLNWLRDRGWICWGIDKHHLVKEDKYHIKDDFETYNFRDLQFDVVWMGHVFEHFRDPVKALKKAYDITPEDGVVVITTPDVDFINQTTPARFPHWKSEEHYIMWNKDSLKREAEKLGFQVIMCRSNFSERYMALWDTHLILQKIYV
jgi:SAM-dependent methyltransferase